MTTTYTIPNRPTDADVRSVGGLLSDFDAVLAALNAFDGSNVQAGTITGAKLVDVAKLGLSTGVVRRGKSVITATETVPSTSFSLLATPDRVQNVVLPTDGLILVLFECLVRSVTSFSEVEAAIFTGPHAGNHFLMNSRQPAGVKGIQSAYHFATVNIWNYICSTPFGLMAGSNESVSAPDPVTTGEAVGASYHATGAPGLGGAHKIGASVNTNNAIVEGGPCAIVAPAGTYDVAVRFSKTAGSPEVKQRRLWVWTISH